MHNQLAKAVVVGGALPLAIAVVMQCGWPPARRRLIAGAVGLVAGALAAPDSRLAGALLATTIAKASYDLLWQPLGIADVVERATYINIGSINAATAAIGNGNQQTTLP